jgi:hypothetical protein
VSHESNIDPVVLNPGDPCAHDEALPAVGNYANYLSFGGASRPDGPLDARGLRRAERAFHEEVQRWLAGTSSFDELLPHLANLAIHPGIRHDRRPLHDAEVVLPDEVLADVAEDEVPDAGVLVERVTGDPLRRPDVSSLAALAWVDLLGEGRRPVDAWAEDEPDRSLVHAMRCIDRAPPCLWSDGRPLLPLNPKMSPPIEAIDSSAARGVFVARAYRVGERWHFSARLDLPVAPPVGAVLARMTVELWRLRTVERRSTWEDALRKRSLALYRACAEGIGCP